MVTNVYLLHEGLGVVSSMVIWKMKTQQTRQESQYKSQFTH